MPRAPIDAFRRATARRLRENATEAERLLWRHLQRIALDGSHFRRQVPIGPYVADFACLAARLIVELDGSQHGEAAGHRRDVVRTRYLVAEGYRVLRFWNNDITENIDGVLETIHAALHGAWEAGPAPLKHARRRRPVGRA